MLIVREISKRFGHVHAVRSVSFQLAPGEVVGLLGPNGAGKSTTIRTIAGLVAPDSGAVRIKGIDAIASPREAKAMLGYLPESAPFHPEMPVRSYLMYRAALAGLPRAARKRATDKNLERCRITSVARQRLGTLSKGYRQRVGLAASLLHDPPVLILDEPTDGLDPTQVQLTRELVRGSAQGRATLLSSHVLSEVERICTRVIVIAGGTLLADGTPDDLITQHGGNPTISVQAKAQSEALRRRLASVTGVGRVRATDMPDGWVHAQADADPRTKDLSSAVAEALAGLMLRELTIHRPSLEAVFTRLVEAAEVKP